MCNCAINRSCSSLEFSRHFPITFLEKLADYWLKCWKNILLYKLYFGVFSIASARFTLHLGLYRCSSMFIDRNVTCCVLSVYCFHCLLQTRLSFFQITGLFSFMCYRKFQDTGKEVGKYAKIFRFL